MPRPITPPVPRTNPKRIPPEPERIYDHWRPVETHVAGTGVGDEIVAGWVIFRSCRILNGEEIEMGPVDDVARLPLENVQAMSVQYPELQAALEAFTAAAVKIAQDRKIL